MYIHKSATPTNTCALHRCIYTVYIHTIHKYVYQMDYTCTYIRARHPRTRAPCIAPCTPFVGCRTTPHRCRPGPHAPRADNSCWGRGGGRGGEAAGVASVSVCEQWAVLRHAPRCTFSKVVARMSARYLISCGNSMLRYVVQCVAVCRAVCCSMSCSVLRWSDVSSLLDSMWQQCVAVRRAACCGVSCSVLWCVVFGMICVRYVTLVT